MDKVDIIVTSGGVSMGEKVGDLSCYIVTFSVQELCTNIFILNVIYFIYNMYMVNLGDYSPFPFQDLLKEVLYTDLRAKLHFGRVFMKPG